MNFQDIFKPSVNTKRISRILDFCDLRSGQLCDLPVVRQWEKSKSSYTYQVRLFVSFIELYYAIVDDPGADFGR